MRAYRQTIHDGFPPTIIALTHAMLDWGQPDAPTWITWVDAKTPQPDFHVAPAFGYVVLQPIRK